MKHLNSEFINRVNTPEVKNYFIEVFKPLLVHATDNHNSKDNYHDLDNLIGVAYISFLMIYYYSGLNLNDIKDNQHIVKAALLQNYCFANKADDRENIAITIDEIINLSRRYKNLFDPGEINLIKIYISLTDKTCAPEKNSPNDFFANPRLLVRQILLDSYALYPALCFNTKILNNLYLDEKTKRNINFEEFKNQKLIDFSKLSDCQTTSFSKIVYKEIKPQLQNYCLKSEEIV